MRMLMDSNSVREARIDSGYASYAPGLRLVLPKAAVVDPWKIAQALLTPEDGFDGDQSPLVTDPDHGGGFARR